MDIRCTVKERHE